MFSFDLWCTGAAPAAVLQAGHLALWAWKNWKHVCDRIYTFSSQVARYIMARYKAREVELWFAISYPYLDIQMSSVSGPKRNLHSWPFANYYTRITSLFFSCSSIVTLFIHTIVSRHTHRGNMEHSAAPFYSTDLIPETRASSAENNHSCVGWESAANQSAADDMTCLHPTAPSSGTDARKTKRLAGEPEVKVETEKYFKWQKNT